MRKVLCIGNLERKDDSIALRIADELNLQKAYDLPESFVSEGDDLILIDAVKFGGEFGEVKILEKDEIERIYSTTHNAISIIFEIAGSVKIIGIQPKDISFGEELSPELAKKYSQIKEKVKKLLDM